MNEDKNGPDSSENAQNLAGEAPFVGELKKRLGRPKGSKNKNPLAALNTPTKKAENFAEKIYESADLTDEELISKVKKTPAKQGRPTKEQGKDLFEERAIVAYRLKIRGLSTEQVAAQMGVSIHTARAYLSHVTKTLKLDPKMLDVGYYMGETLAFYQEIRQMAMLHTSGKASVSEKLNAMRVAMQAEQEKNRFLENIGVYSPSVVKRVESWIASMITQMLESPESSTVRVNLAAEVGRLLASKARTEGSISTD